MFGSLDWEFNDESVSEDGFLGDESDESDGVDDDDDVCVLV